MSPRRGATTVADPATRYRWPRSTDGTEVDGPGRRDADGGGQRPPSSSTRRSSSSCPRAAGRSWSATSTSRRWPRRPPRRWPTRSPRCSPACARARRPSSSPATASRCWPDPPTWTGSSTPTPSSPRRWRRFAADKRPPRGGALGQPRRPAGLGRRRGRPCSADRLGVEHFALPATSSSPPTRVPSGSGWSTATSPIPTTPSRTRGRRSTPPSATTWSGTSCPSSSPARRRGRCSKGVQWLDGDIADFIGLPPLLPQDRRASCGWWPSPSWPSCSCGC